MDNLRWPSPRDFLNFALVAAELFVLLGQVTRACNFLYQSTCGVARANHAFVGNTVLTQPASLDPCWKRLKYLPRSERLSRLPHCFRPTLARAHPPQKTQTIRSTLLVFTRKLYCAAASSACSDFFSLFFAELHLFPPGTDLILCWLPS